MLIIKKAGGNITKILSRKKLGAGLLVGFSLLTWVLVGSADDDTENLIALHDSSSPQYNENCNECHADIHTAQSLDPAIPAAHVAMLPFAPGETGDDEQCVVCHRTVNLVQGTPQPEGKSKGDLRKHVDSAYCTLCHGPSGPGTQFYQADLSSIVSDGATLYGLACSGCHRDLANSQVKGESADEIQEAILEDEGGMEPLNAFSAQQIQAIADALAESALQGGDDD